MTKIGRHFLVGCAGIAAVAGIWISATPTQAEEHQSQERTARQWPPGAPRAKVTPIQAMTAAKAKLGGGTAFSANFEFDEGQWVYDVMIVKGHKIVEVTVDPISGTEKNAGTLTPDAEAQEAKADLTIISKAGG